MQRKFLYIILIICIAVIIIAGIALYHEFEIKDYSNAQFVDSEDIYDYIYYAQ